jgi:hypothetical protein
MNILILTPDRVGSTLLQRLVTVYANINEPDNLTVNLHELTNGIAIYQNDHYSKEMLGKKENSWGYHQNLSEIVGLLQNSKTDITSRLAHYHLKNRQDPVKDQLSFYEYLNDNFYIISARRKNLLEHALSWGITVDSKRLNVYSFEEKYQTFKNMHNKGINIDQNTLVKYLNQYHEYTAWVDNHFRVNAYFDYEDHLPTIENFILNLTPFKQIDAQKTWHDHFGISWTDWNRMHYLLSLVMFDHEFTQDEKQFMKDQIELYRQCRVVLQDMQDHGVLVSGIPIKLQTLSEKSQIIKNLDYCLTTYNHWISSVRPNYALGYKHTDLIQIASTENTKWKTGNIDTSSLLTYNDIDSDTLKKSDLKFNE